MPHPPARAVRAFRHPDEGDRGSLYQQFLTAQETDRRVRAAADRVFVDGHKPYQWRHGWIPITPDAIRDSDAMRDLLDKGRFLHDGQDIALREIVRQKGFDQPPTLVDPERLQEVVDSGRPEMWRGVAQPGHVEQFRTGDYFAGIYVLSAEDPAQAANAQDLTGRTYGRNQIRMTLAPDAHVVDFDSIKPLQKADLDAAQDERRALRQRLYDAEGRGENTTELEDELDRNRRWQQVLEDPGRWAALNGYDAIRAVGGIGDLWGEGLRETVVLNRGALLVDRSV